MTWKSESQQKWIYHAFPYDLRSMKMRIWLYSKIYVILQDSTIVSNKIATNFQNFKM